MLGGGIMRIRSFEFSYIKSFRSLIFDLKKTSVLIGQNDHGKSSILKAIDIILNQLDDDALDSGVLHPDYAERLLPIFPVKAKARRITVNYEDGSRSKRIFITVRADLTFTILEKITRGAKTTKSALDAFKKIREQNKFSLIPAMRDASSMQFQDLFSKILKERGLAEIIPQKAGGTPKEYRKLKSIREDVSRTIKPFVDEKLLPQIEKYFGFRTEHKLALKFDTDVQEVGEWILSNLKLGFQLDDDEGATLALSEAGSGIQSGVLLALHRLEQHSTENPDIQYILAIEEPEAFLHPQKQRELYQDILSAQSDNLRVIVTTHSPYIVADTPFSSLGIVRKQDKHSALFTPDIRSTQEAETFDAYASEVNSVLFFADKVVFVEGESDARVLRVLLEKKMGAKAHRISVISASGNQNFSPFLRMVRAWNSARIPHLVVTDFDSLMATTERAILKGAKDAGYALVGEQRFIAKVDNAIDKHEPEFRAVASEATSFFQESGLNVFVFTSDLEFSLITESNKREVATVLNTHGSRGANYSQGYDLGALKRLIGSKGIPLQPANDPQFKKPFIHRKIANTIDLADAHGDIERLLNAIEGL